MLTQTQELDFVIARALDLVERPLAWVQGMMALDVACREVAPEDPRACRFCLAGAIIRAANELIPRPTRSPWEEPYLTTRKRTDLVNGAMALVENVVFGKSGDELHLSVGGWNDEPGRGAVQVAHVLRRARPCTSYAGGAGA